MRSIAALCAVVLLVPSWSAADPFNEFRIPAHSWQSGTASFSMKASRYDASSAGTTDQMSKDQSAQGSGDLRFDRAYDSDRLAHGWTIAVGNNLYLSRSERATSYEFSPTHDRQKEWSRAPVEAAVLSAYLRSYREDSRIGLQLSASGGAQWWENLWRSDRVTLDDLSDSRNETRDSRQQIDYRYIADLSAILGFGLVRDATVVQDVYVMERRLQEAGVLSRPLSAAARAQLAQLLQVIPRLYQVHNRPTRFAWREIERVLREDGALVDGRLDAYSQSYAMEFYRVGPEWRRATGSFVGLMLRGSHEHQIRREDEHTGYRIFLADTLFAVAENSFALHRDFEVDQLDIGPSLEWHRPVGWRWQWDAFSRALIGARTKEKGLLTESGIAVAWLVADRWQARGSLQHFREYRVPETSQSRYPVDRWSVRSTLSLDYFLEDHLKVTAQYVEGQERSTSFSPYLASPRGRFIRNDSIYLALTYRFLGRVSAPGLMETMRPL